MMINKTYHAMVSHRGPTTVVEFTDSDIFVYMDGFGRVYIDKCKDPGEHLMAKTPEFLDRRICQNSLESMIPPIAYNGKGSIRITIEYTPEPKKES